MSKRIWIISHYAMTPAQGTLTRHYLFVKHLMKKGYDCRIFASSAIHNTNTNMIKGRERSLDIVLDDHNYTYIRTRDYKSNFERVLNMVDFFFGVLSVSKNYEKPDVIYASTPDILSALAGVIIARRLKLRCVLEVRDLWPETIVQYKGKYKYNPFLHMLYLLEKWLYVKADRLIFTMEGGMDYIRHKGWDKKIDEKKVCHINNGCDLENISHNMKTYAYDFKDLDDPNLFKVAYAGSIRYANDVRQIVNCAKILTDRGHGDIILLIFGEGDQKNELIQFCREHGISNVFFRGYVDKKYIPGILSRTDVNLIHYRSNSVFQYGYSGNKMFDYLASGKPILSDIYCNPKFDILLRYDCGITVGGGSAEALADGLLRLHGMAKEAREACGSRARRAAEDYDYKKLTELLEKALFQE